ncbi:hypothetical protein Lal_00018845 [Lupinus albus]|nr:hypothetical protein Lal_00018845 [Lupinus albus]
MIEKTTPEKDSDLSDVDPVQTTIHDLDTAENDVQNDEQHDDVVDQQLGDVPIDDAEEENEMSQDENFGDAPDPPQVQPCWSNR